MKGYFVTGTDTGVGKTLIAAALVRALNLTGARALGMKPIAAGAFWKDERWCNEDVEVLVAAASPIQADLSLLNPYLLKEATAPHIAAAKEGVEIDIERIVQAFDRLAWQVETVVVEGAGGFLVPLGPSRDAADLAVRLALPVILVVGMRLGCLNHALLTCEAIRSRNLVLAGWVANQIDPAMANLEENVDTLRQRIGVRPLAVVPHLAAPDPAALALRMLGRLA